MENNGATVSLIMPVYNGETTILKALESIWKNIDDFDELIIINDASTDDTIELLELSSRSARIIGHEKNLGLARSYNDGINMASGELIITIHQDVLLEKGAIKKIIEPFRDKKVVAASHSVIHPEEIWNKYNFWQKCFFARKAGKKEKGIDGKFDCFRRGALLKAGLFDAKHFRSAGEDGDMVHRLKKIGQVVGSEAEIIHVHKISPDFSWQDIIQKQKQYSEAQGTLLRLGRINGAKNIVRTFFREILILALLIPYLQLLSIVMIVVYSFWYTKKMFFLGWDKRLIILPAFNIYLLFISFIYSFKGFVYGRQRI